MQAIESLLQSLTGNTPNLGDGIALASIVVLVVVSLLQFLSKPEVTKTEEKPKVAEKTQEVQKDNEPASVVEKKVEPPKVSFVERLKTGLGKSRTEIWGKLEKIVSGSSLGEEEIEQIEELLYSADIGSQTVSELIEELEKQSKQDVKDLGSLKQFLFNFLNEKMESIQSGVDQELFRFDEKKEKKTKVIMVVGVNGAGKTTTIGKLATKLKGQGAEVVVAACDTFRAAAVDQLQVWCERSGAQMVRAKEGADPSGVAYEALEKAKAMNADYCIIDTAGRLHTKANLMEELKKNKRVLTKLDEDAPHQVLLVIDAITGQNAMKQAEEFNKALEVTGLVFTKCDGSAKAGNAVSIVQKLNIPITYIGVGESVEDLDIFNLEDYLRALLDFWPSQQVHA